MMTGRSLQSFKSMNDPNLIHGFGGPSLVYLGDDHIPDKDLHPEMHQMITSDSEDPSEEGGSKQDQNGDNRR